ncbi:UvrABC system protein C [Sphingobium jiangsuense]|uniref:UvrABC system protein C n=1 Tax=Sphingobium jiangsuense TaxID=870476 RepID=A0A7W6FMX7_9SPHN|nr:excinuclease ABC subunit UvrC [Sphingobium jiangsuense]MBB3924506.1 excinuclease ABC subunit C [Sphingobium jiangsuense]GLT01578.1 UvrABC system protein C [Sphingobium jiangsuense]
MASTDLPDRFNEEKSVFTVRGAGAPDIETGVAAIREVVRTLPLRPGVYRMLDARGDVLYVGKAKALKNRVTNYTQVMRLPRRLQRMVSQTRAMEIVTTGSEAEALLLEAQLIKRYRPPYNVLLRDDKSFPFILVRHDHAFPRIQKHRGARKAEGRYFGPYAGAGQVNRTLNALQKLFLLRSCTDSFFRNRARPCLLYQIRRCSAPCVGRIDEAAYAELVADAEAFLDGKGGGVQAKLADAMNKAAEALDYELAAVYRDRLKALTFVQNSGVASQGVEDADIFALASEGGAMCIQAFFLRGGQHTGSQSLFPVHTQEVSEDEVMFSFLAQFYEDVPPARLILLDRQLEEGMLLEEALSTKIGRKVRIEVPQRGPRTKLIEEARRNAAEALQRRQAESTGQAKLLAGLADLFGLEGPPDRIEVYDNSHIQGAHALGAMIVAGPEGFRKNAYRKFNIKDPDTRPGDDFAMMREVFTRRFAPLVEKEARADSPEREKGEWPDLVLIDGGKGQLSAAREMLEELGIEDVPLVGVAKGPHHGREGREVFHLLDGREIMLPLNDPLLFYLQRLRDEAHRFVIGAHRGKRSKAITTSSLDEVPGIGPARKKALLMHFGTARAVKDARLEDLQRAPGVSRAVAQAVYDYFHPGG